MTVSCHPPNQLLQLLNAADFDLLRPYLATFEMVSKSVVGDSVPRGCGGKRALSQADGPATSRSCSRMHSNRCSAGQLVSIANISCREDDGIHPRTT
ncbi:hypothetical protein [Bradyrhizobium agreste]|uniref:hypothetical protein n=1 Tax=Bradyrhizobium agreste TaxID=2751811 RepID=UPI001FEB6F22|nr:hypothetical protein [Bradyrhizobium agreste]